MLKRYLIALVGVFSLFQFSLAEEIDVKVACWNLESGSARVPELMERVEAIDGVDIWGFTEVLDRHWMFAMRRATEAGENGDFWFERETTGGSDKMCIIYDRDKFEGSQAFELDKDWFAAPNIRLRAPLILKLKHKESGVRFWVMVNHLASGKQWKRREGARRISEWVKNRPGGYPVICFGDMNLRYKVEPPHEHDTVSMNHLEKFMNWIKPSVLVRTEDSNNSVLDFIFATPDISGTSEIIVESDDFERNSSDHRIVTGDLKIDG